MFNNIARNRRSVRQFTDQPVEKEKINQIIEAALRSPSGLKKRPWHFVVVTDDAVKDKLSQARPGGKDFVKNAPLAIVVCGDPAASRLWVEDCTIAAVTMQYAAVSAGLGSCWYNIRNMAYNEDKSSSAYIAELIGLPSNQNVLCIIAIGYPESKPVPYDKGELHYDKVNYYTTK